MKNEKNWKSGYWKWLGIEKCYLEEKRREEKVRLCGGDWIWHTPNALLVQQILIEVWSSQMKETTVFISTRHLSPTTPV